MGFHPFSPELFFRDARAVTSDQNTGKVFFAEFNHSTEQITVLSFDSQTPKQIEQVVIPLPAGLPSMGGPTQLVRVANANTVTLVTESGYIVALSGPMFAP
jgi:hypothetical protein